MRQEKPPANIEVIPASLEQQPVLANLLELYGHDFSEFHDLEIGADGRFGYGHLPLYWSEPGRHPFLIRMDTKLAGLVFVKRGPAVSGDGSVWDMAEFFILRGYRRRGIGTQAAHEVWRQFPGLWEVRVMQSNVAALHFWARSIAAFVGADVQAVRLERKGRGAHRQTGQELNRAALRFARVPQKRKGCGAHLQTGQELNRAALRFARVPQKNGGEPWQLFSFESKRAA